MGVMPLRYTNQFMSLPDAAQVRVAIDDFGHEPVYLTTELLPLPVLPQDAMCEVIPYSGQCDQGLVCQVSGGDEQGICTLGQAPEITDARAYLAENQIVVSVDGRDDNEDISGVRVKAYSAEGEVRLDTISIPVVETRPLEGEGVGLATYFIVIDDWDNFADVVALDVSLTDESDLQSLDFLIAPLTPIARVNVNEPCDQSGLTNLCLEGLCVRTSMPNPDRLWEGVCIDQLPAIGVVCDIDGAGCDTGLI
jgi:hypothetical protein